MAALGTALFGKSTSESQKRRRLIGALMAFAGLAVTGCAEGWKGSEDEAREWLPSAAPDLKRAVVLLRQCHPRRPSGYNNVWVKGDGGDEVPHCSFGDDTALSELKRLMRKAGVLGVSYSPSGSDRKPVPHASFVLHRQGIVTSGSLTSVDYHADPKPCSEIREGDDSFRVVHRPLTGAPCRWFWVNAEN